MHSNDSTSILFVAKLIFAAVFVFQSVMSKTEINGTSTCFNGQSLQESIDQVFQCRCDLFDPSGNSTVIFKIAGRLGNRMLGYAMMLGLKRKFGFKVYLEPNVLSSLNYYFEDAKEIESLETICVDHPSFKWKRVLGPLELQDPKNKTGSAFEIPRQLTLLGKGLIDALQWDTVLNPIEAELRRAFTFKKKFLDLAQERLHKVAKDYLSKQKNRSKKVKLTFIGIHLRKTDYDTHVVPKYNLSPIPASYYLSAIDLFHERHKHPIFLLIGDDMVWGRRHILARAGSAAVFAVGSGLTGDQDAVGADMATLAQCNHTILSYGSFSFWGGFLSGGKRVIPSMVMDRRGLVHPLDLDLQPFVMSDQVVDQSKLRPSAGQGGR